MDEIEHRARRVRGSPAIVLYLSLFLLLLTFFILLNSISQAERERTVAAIGSVNVAFRGTAPAPDLDEHRQTVTRLHRELKGVFAREWPRTRFKTIGDGSVLQVTLPLDRVFTPGMAQLRRERVTLMNGIAGSLIALPPNVENQVEIVVPEDIAPAAPTVTARQLAVLRAGALARELVARGVEEKVLAVGVQPGGGNDLVLTFLTRRSTDGATANDGG
jgi:hypothetical protein